MPWSCLISPPFDQVPSPLDWILSLFVIPTSHNLVYKRSIQTSGQHDGWGNVIAASFPVKSFEMCQQLQCVCHVIKLENIILDVGKSRRWYRHSSKHPAGTCVRTNLPLAPFELLHPVTTQPFENKLFPFTGHYYLAASFLLDIPAVLVAIFQATRGKHITSWEARNDIVPQRLFCSRFCKRQRDWKSITLLR